MIIFRRLSELSLLLLGLRLDKSEQQSNWARRPLTQEQIDYAAADASVAVDIFKSMLQSSDYPAAAQLTAPAGPATVDTPLPAAAFVITDTRVGDPDSQVVEAAAAIQHLVTTKTFIKAIRKLPEDLVDDDTVEGFHQNREEMIAKYARLFNFVALTWFRYSTDSRVRAFMLALLEKQRSDPPPYTSLPPPATRLVVRDL